MFRPWFAPDVGTVAPGIAVSFPASRDGFKGFVLLVGYHSSQATFRFGERPLTVRGLPRYQNYILKMHAPQREIKNGNGKVIEARSDVFNYLPISESVSVARAYTHPELCGRSESHTRRQLDES